jgi:flotillin
MTLIVFIATLLGLLLLTLILQLISKMKIVGGNELGIVAGRFGKRGFSTLSGGRVFVIPLLHRFAKISLTPHTIEVIVDSAIAAEVIPLNVKATVSFAIASNEAGRARAVTRILNMAGNPNLLRETASSIIEGHLRDSIASMTPEQVMQDKDTLVAKMINVCKSDLENIGLEITTMNIADVDDQRLEGVVEPDLYIALLKRIQTANAQAQARQAKAEADAAAKEEEEERRADVSVRDLENQYENLVAVTKVKVAQENQRKAVGIENAERNAAAQVAGIKAAIEAEKQRIEMLKKKFEAEIITPALAQKDRSVLKAKAEAAMMMGKAQAEIDQLEYTLKILEQKDEMGKEAYIIENFERLVAPFAETLSLFPVKKLSVITGAQGKHEPISAIHPNAIDDEKNKLIAGAISSALGMYSEEQKKKAEDKVQVKHIKDAGRVIKKEELKKKARDIKKRET